MLFIVGSACFAVGSLPGYASLVGATADGVTYFVGSIFFTGAAYLQYVECISAPRNVIPEVHRRARLLAVEARRIDWWATAIQLAGTIFFNVTTFTALDAHLTAKRQDLVVWTPDAFGSICFLVASELAFAEAGHAWLSWRPGSMGWRIAALNLARLRVLRHLSDRRLGAAVRPATCSTPRSTPPGRSWERSAS